MEIQFIDPDLLWDCQTIQYTYEKATDPTLEDVLHSDEIQPRIKGLKADQLVFICTSTYQHEDADAKEKLSILRKKLKYKKLYIRKALQSEVHIPADQKCCVMIHESFK